jgi:hypothetical protein
MYHTWKMKIACEIVAGKSKDTWHLAHLSIDGRILLKWVLKKKRVRLKIGFIWLRL